MKTDHQLRQDVIEELAWDPCINDNEIGVEVKDGVVTLSGHLDSFAGKYAAERATQNVEGVRAIAVEIEVRLPGESKRTDSDIASTAQRALDWNALIPKDRIKIIVEGGHLTLSGEVDWAYQRQAAENTVRNLMGVVGVHNQITVKAAVLSKNVKSSIEAALQRRAHQEVKAISVLVNGNQVTLTGSVPSLADRRTAFMAALSAPGVTRVIDKLVII